LQANNRSDRKLKEDFKEIKIVNKETRN